MENFRAELDVLVDKLETNLSTRQKKYEDYLTETGLTPNVHTVGELQHIKMEIDSFKRAIALAEYHTSTVPNFTLTYNQLNTQITNLVFKSLPIRH